MRPTTSRRPSPLKILRAHVQAKADTVLRIANDWADDTSFTQDLQDAAHDYREARALLDQAEGRFDGT